MNKVVTSQEEILNVSKKIILESGINSLNMRLVAKECNISIGAIYNYFNSKTDLIISTIKFVWTDIFSDFYSNSTDLSFLDAVKELFSLIKTGAKKYPGFFNVHSLNFSANDLSEGKETMANYLDFIKERLLEVLNNDKLVKEEKFNEVYTKREFIDYIFTLLIYNLIHKNDCASLLIHIQYAIY